MLFLWFPSAAKNKVQTTNVPRTENDDNLVINRLCGQKLLVQAAGHMENVSAERGAGDKHGTREACPGDADLARPAALTEKTALASC